MNKKPRLLVLANIGDCIRIPLPDGRNAYGQYVYWHDQFAAMVRIWDVIARHDVDLNILKYAKSLFPPVFVGFNNAIREKHWRIVGNLPVTDFEFPTFRCTRGFTHGLEPGEFEDWMLWDGIKYTDLGVLPKELRSLEYLAAWASGMLEERIATGRNFPFAEML